MLHLSYFIIFCCCNLFRMLISNLALLFLFLFLFLFGFFHRSLAWTGSLFLCFFLLCFFLILLVCLFDCLFHLFPRLLCLFLHFCCSFLGFPFGFFIGSFSICLRALRNGLGFFLRLLHDLLCLFLGLGDLLFVSSFTACLRWRSWWSRRSWRPALFRDL